MPMWTDSDWIGSKIYHKMQTFINHDIHP